MFITFIDLNGLTYYKNLGIDCFLFSAKHETLPDGVLSAQELIESLAQLGIF